MGHNKRISRVSSHLLGCPTPNNCFWIAFLQIPREQKPSRLVRVVPENGEPSFVFFYVEFLNLPDTFSPSSTVAQHIVIRRPSHPSKVNTKHPNANKTCQLKTFKTDTPRRRKFDSLSQFWKARSRAPGGLLCGAGSVCAALRATGRTDTAVAQA